MIRVDGIIKGVPIVMPSQGLAGLPGETLIIKLSRVHQRRVR